MPLTFPLTIGDGPSVPINIPAGNVLPVALQNDPNAPVGATPIDFTTVVQVVLDVVRERDLSAATWVTTTFASVTAGGLIAKYTFQAGDTYLEGPYLLRPYVITSGAPSTPIPLPTLRLRVTAPPYLAAPPPIILVSIAVTPAPASTPFGTPLQFTAIGTYSSGPTQDLTDSVTWTSSDTSIATIDDAGLATPIVHGSTNISAALGDVTSNVVDLTVTSALVSITVLPANITIAFAATQQYSATGHYTDGSAIDITGAVTWMSSNTAIVTIDDTGLATALLSGGGSLSITATDPTTMIDGSTGLTVDAPALPASPVFLLDASNASLIQRASAPAPDGEFVDDWNGAIQATAAIQPTNDLYAIGGPGVWFGSHARPDIEPGTVTYLVAPSVGMSLPCIFLALGIFNNSLSNATAPAWELGNTSTGVGVLFDALGHIKVVGPSGTLTGTVTWTLTDNGLHDVVITCTGTAILVELDGVSLTVTPSGTAPGTGSIAGDLTIGADHTAVDTAMWIGVCGFLGGWNRVLTTTEKLGWRAYLLLRWYRARTGSAEYNVLQDGDSIAHGDQCDPTGDDSPQLSHGNKLVQYLGTIFGTIHNDSRGGARLTIDNVEENIPSVLTQWNDTSSGEIEDNVDNVARAQGGINDLAAIAPANSDQAIAAAATISGYLATVVNKMTSDLSGHPSGPKGHRVVVSQMTAWTTSGSVYFGQCRGLVNATTAATYDGVSINGVRVELDDVGEDPVIGLDGFGRNGVDYPHFNYTTGPHPSQIGQNRWAGLQVIKFRQLGLAAGSLTSLTLSPLAYTANINPVPELVQLSAIGTYSDAPPVDLSAYVTWVSSNTAVATVSTEGIVTYGGTPGTTTITATFLGVSQHTTLSYGALFIPSSATSANLALWNRIDLGATVTMGSLLGLADQSTHGRNATGTVGPAYSPAVGAKFPFALWTGGTLAQLVNGSLPLTQPFEFFIVAEAIANAGGNFYLIDFGVNDCALILNAGTTELWLYPGPTTVSLSPGPHIIDCILDGASTSIAIDGGSPVIGSVSANPSRLTIGNVGTGSSAQSYSGIITEIAVFDAPLSTPEHADMLVYIASTKRRA